MNIFLLVFYSFGTFCLPLGDFASLIDLPEMYRHCKATEDKDMNPIDFITDHLLNIDGLFDKHNNGDEQKPHTPIPIHHSEQLTLVLTTYFIFSWNELVKFEVKQTMHKETFFKSDFISTIFRPPIHAC